MPKVSGYPLPSAQAVRATERQRFRRRRRADLRESVLPERGVPDRLPRRVLPCFLFSVLSYTPP